MEIRQAGLLFAERLSALKNKRTLLLAIWVIGIIFPMAWLGLKNAQFKAWFDAIFSPLWMHILMHALLYAVLALILAWITARPQQSLPLVRLLSIVLSVAILQEAFQAWSASFLYWPGIIFDWVNDLAGAAAGLWVFSLIRLRKLTANRS